MRERGTYKFRDDGDEYGDHEEDSPEDADGLFVLVVSVDSKQAGSCEAYSGLFLAES